MRWKGVLDFLGQAAGLSRRPKQGRSPRSAAEITRLRARERREEQAAFVTAMTRVLKANPKTRSRIYVISLADFHEAVADKWSRLADKVAMLTRTIIQRHLGHLSLFAQADDETFVLALPTMGRQAARRRIVGIMNDLSGLLLGDQLVSGRRPVPVAANMPFAAAVAADGMLNSRAIRQSVDGARALIDIRPDASAAPAEAGEVEDFDELVQGAERISLHRIVIDEVRPPAPAEGNSPESGADQAEGRGMQRAKRKAEQRWQAFHMERMMPAVKLTDLSPEDDGPRMSLLWRPTWSADTEAVSAFYARVVRAGGASVAPLEGPAAYAAATGNQLAVDRHVVGAAVTALREAEGSGSRITVIIPVRWSSLAPATRWQLTGPIADLPSLLRHDRAAIEIFDLPAQLSPAGLRDVVDFIRGLGCTSLIRLQPSSAPVGLVSEAKPSMIGLDLADLAPDEQMGDNDLLANLARFSRMSARHGVGCYLWGARRRRVLGGAIQEGFKMVNGPGLIGDLGHPHSPLQVSRDYLLANG